MNTEQIQTFNRKEAARLLGVSVVTLDRLTAQNLISHCKVGRRTVFQSKHISEFLDCHTRKAVGKAHE